MLREEDAERKGGKSEVVNGGQRKVGGSNARGQLGAESGGGQRH